MSADGSVVVGASRHDKGLEAFRWTAEEGMRGLGDLPGGRFNSVAHDVSADGSVIVGAGFSDTERAAFRWTESEGIQNLGRLPKGYYRSHAASVSADGSMIVGSIVQDEDEQSRVEATSPDSAHQGARWSN